MKKIFALLMIAISFVGCTKDWDDDLIDPKNPVSVPAPMLFANAQRNLVDQMVTPNVNSGIFRLISQHWANTTYPEESRYDLVSRNIPQNFWFTLYRDVLMDFREASIIINDDQALNATTKANQLAVIEVMEVYTWSVLVNTFGDIPYSEALNRDIIYPTYDDDAAIYADLFARLDAAIATMNAEGAAGAGSFGSSDLIYGGNIARWLTFANSLKLKLGMTVADVNPERARTAASEAAPGVFKSAADQAVFRYTATTPNVNPVWSNLVQSGRNDFVPAATLVDRMNELNDPRRAAYFTLHNGAYVGGIYGNNNTYANFSKVNPTITAPDFPAILLGYEEIEFYLAEAAARGFITAAPGDHYRKAITASMAQWGVAEGQATAYLAQPRVAAYLAAMSVPGPANSLTELQREALGVQKWIALYERPFHAWTEFRRLDYPQLQAPDAQYRPAYNTVPVRYPYPPTERTLNPDAVNAAASAIGGDEATTRIFWDAR
ncbi:SusD/RagB family nutrient-binding outer membrane lipoprotein [Pontibacter virosus]|uniref:SusD-like starch-binding protein associating with outer membrane n=1 Tax=Pontibacter virosus TaxID=1765052 RepID=A0A2U1ASR1_9BACT|nr:SusD/RagB family nutrient-binding outer membrane lipoprotein [Pontibacter virosus]PVY39307.1 SusD-like starch-binding protein associating with outer membrane [Pontibacter virosus]